MSEYRKRQLAAKANATTRDEQERRTWKLLKDTRCPLVSVFSATGGPSTENSFCCNYTGKEIAGWWPDCPSFGQVKGCKLIKLFYQRKLYEPFHKLRLFQTSLDHFEQKAAGCVGWWELK